MLYVENVLAKIHLRMIQKGL